MISPDDSLRAWVEAQALPLLRQGFTQPDVLVAIEPELPQRLLSAASRPGLRSQIRDLARRNGFRVVAEGVSEPGPSRQLVMFSLEEIIALAVKRIRQGGDILSSLRRDLEVWCAAHPESGETPESILAAAS